VIPAEIPAEVSERIRETARRAYGAVSGAGLSRVDFFYCEDGRLILNEINTIPGFTEISMYAMLFKQVGVGNGELVKRLIELAMEK